MKKKVSLIIFLILIFSMSVISYAAPAYDEEYYDTRYRNNTYQAENIRDYDVEIHVNKDSSMDVIENITVYANGRDIKHGIYRDFPTEYENKRVILDVQEVLCDGEYVRYALESVDRGIRIKIGDADEDVENGIHTYTIKYKTERQLAYYDDYDELYWNVIGSGWNFDIEKCHAKIYFPEGTKFIEDKLKTYTGKFGTKGDIANVSYYIWESENSVEFNIYDKLWKQEAFTVSICFEKGAIDEPTLEMKVKWFLEDNCIPVIIFTLLIVLIIWQYFIWKKHGKDPEANVIIPKYYPPEGLEPAAVRYIEKMGNTTNALEATILNLAVKGFLKFSKEGKRANMVIEKIPKENAETELSPNELAVYTKLKDKETLKYSSSLQSKLSSLKLRISKELKDKYDGKLFIINDKYMVISVVLSMVIIVISGIVGTIINKYAAEQCILGMFFAVFCSVFIIMFLEVIKSICKTAKRVGLIGKILLIGFFVVFFGYMIIGMTATIVTTVMSNVFMACAGMALILDNYIFMQLVKRYTEEGQVVKEDIEGFKMFINTAKDDDFADKTPEMFDKYFPYAYALGLQNKWAEKFESVLSDAGYSPNWCDDNMMDHGMFNVVVFTNSFSSSFSSGMSSASTAPSSSGGSGGGGFSGGGGGGRWPEAAGNAYAY